MLICFGTNTNKYINHISPGESKYMEIPMIRYLYHSADLSALCIMLEG